MVHCTYNMLNMFRAPLYPSPGTRDYMCYYGLWCAMSCLLMVGGQMQGSSLCVGNEGFGSTRAKPLIPDA